MGLFQIYFFFVIPDSRFCGSDGFAAASCLLTSLKGSCDNEFHRGEGRRGVLQETHAVLQTAEQIE